MPKVKSPPPVAEAPKESPMLASRNDERKPVYRVFECIVHLEQAIRSLESVGITPPILSETSDARRKMIVDLKQQLADYKAYWINLR